MSNKIKPEFNKNMPKNARLFFNPVSDNAYKAEHPKMYNVWVAGGITALMLPVIIYMIFVIGIYPAPNSAWMILGWVGAFIIGIGFFNIVAAWIGQYLGHLVTGLCISIGALMVCASVLLLYNETLYNLFDQEMVNYYFINLFFLCLPALYYVVFRFSINRWLVRVKRISKSTIKSEKKGKKNFWWYEAINAKYRMGLLHVINRLFTIAFPTALILHFLFGWIKIVSILVSILVVISCILAAMMSLFSSIQSNKEVHGKPFVLIARSENDGIDSTVLDIVIAAFPLGIAYAELIAISNLWQLPWHLAII